MRSANGINGRRKVRSLIDTWVRFGEFLKTSLGKEGVQNAQEEEFLRLKAKIAHLLPVLTVIEKGRSIDPEALAAVRDITDMLNSFTTLATPEPLTREETEGIISQWHTIFIFLNKLEGALKDRRYGFLPRPGEVQGEEGWFCRVFNNWFARSLVSLVIAVAGVFLVAGLLGVTAEQATEALNKGVAAVLGKGPTGTTGTVVSEAGDAAGRAGSGGAAATGIADRERTARRETVGGKLARGDTARTSFARGAAEKRSIVPTPLKPLVRQYGKHLTMILFAMFLAGIVSLFFLRVK